MILRKSNIAVRAGAILLGACALVATVRAQGHEEATPIPPHSDTPTPPAAAAAVNPGSRIIKTFDFEEKAAGNFETTPMFWSKVADRGYPIYAAGKFVTDVHRSGATSFRMDIDGGSVAYQFEPGRIEANPNADYYVLGFVKTTPMEHARAEISAWFADDKGHPIPGTMVHSDHYASPVRAALGGAGAAAGAGAGGADAEWHVLHLYLPGQNIAAIKSLVLQMGLLQPQQMSNGALGKFELYHQDIKGSAWFDDLVVFQLPRLALACPPKVAGNIFASGQAAQLDLTVSDLGRDKLSAAVSIADAEGKRVAGERWDIEVDATKPWTQRYEAGLLPPGEYTATLDVLDRNSLVARRKVRFLCLSAASLYDRPAAEFGVCATEWPAEVWNELPVILRHTGVGVVKLPAWRREMSEEALLRQDQPFDALINALSRLEIRTQASFAEVPTVVRERLIDKKAGQGDSVLSLMEADPSIWRPYMSFLLARYAARVDLWELGGHGDGGAADRFGGADARFARQYGKAYAELAGLLSKPQLEIPWNALYDFDAKQYPHAVLDLRLPASIRPAQIPAYIASFAAEMNGAAAATSPAMTGPATTAPATLPGVAPLPVAPDVIAFVEPLDASNYRRNDRLGDFAQRVVYARSAGPRATFIDLPVERRSALGSLAAFSEPDELLSVYRTLVRSLGGAACKGELKIAPGIKAFLFDHHGVATIALWSDARPQDETALDLPLGPGGARRVDLLGNAAPLAADAKTGLTRVTLTGTPVLLEQVDSRLLELRGSFTLDPARMPAGVGAVTARVTLMNPFAEPLAGVLKLLPPKGWTADPPTIAVSLSPGGALNQAVTVRYPYAESVGPKTMAARFTQDGTGQIVEMSCPLTLTSDLVEMECFAEVLPGSASAGGAELVLQQMITNVSDTAIDAQAYAMVPGFSRQQRFVLGLKPGQTVLKRFSFPLTAMAGANGSEAAALELLRGKTASLGLKQTDGKTLVTKTVSVE